MYTYYKYNIYTTKIMDMYVFMCVLEFVCLFNWSLRAETRLGPDGIRLEQNAQARLLKNKQTNKKHI